MRIGITGHQTLSESDQWQWVLQAFDALMPSMTAPLVGVTCLALGADQLFAEAVLKCSGTIEVVLPFPDYATTFDEQTVPRYRQLLAKAATVIVLPKQPSDEESYMNAGKTVVDLSHLMVAVWNGKPAGGLGGTADIVEYANQQEKRVIWLNPVLQQIIHLP